MTRYHLWLKKKKGGGGGGGSGSEGRVGAWGEKEKRKKKGSEQKRLEQKIKRDIKRYHDGGPATDRS